MDEVVVDAVLVLNKKLKLRTINGQLIVGLLKVYECENPYILILQVDADNHSITTDIKKDDLAFELRQWLEGKIVRNPACLISLRVEEAMNKFVKFGKTPLQEDLIMWILSRSELYLGKNTDLVFGGKLPTQSDPFGDEEQKHYEMTNEFSRNASNAVMSGDIANQQYRIDSDNFTSHLTEGEKKLDTLRKNASKTRTYQHTNDDDQGMFEMTRKLLGKSTALEMIKTQRVKGREGAKQTMTTAKFTSDHYRLCTDIERARKDVEEAMDERRRTIEVAKIRQLQRAEKYRAIRDSLNEAKSCNKFVNIATQELLSLQKIAHEIKEDILKQKNVAHRGAQKVAWTIAPSGYSNRRGKSMRGPLIGKGPLPPNATSKLRDPRIESTIRHFYWDSAGRRHVKRGDDEEGASIVETALNAIRRAAANISAFKLNLKEVFEQFDTSGDGFLSPQEMAEAFLAMGVKLDLESMNAIFKHFDPNDSGSVHYGEFVWAFFNRRGLVRKWKRTTEKMTTQQIQAKFHQADINGNGRLNKKEFMRLLKLLGMDLPEAEVDILMERFDMDGDGDLDLHEFLQFMESEQKNLAESTAVSTGTAAAVALPKPKNVIRTVAVKQKVHSMDDLHVRSTPESAKTGAAGAMSRSTVLNRTDSRPRTARPSSAAPSRGHNATAPASTKVPLAATTTTARPTSASAKSHIERMLLAEDNDGEYGTVSEADVLWSSRMLQAQAEIEAKLGNKYFS